MGKRFNNLEDTYNTLVAANFNFDTLPATNKYRKYAEWKQDPVDILPVRRYALHGDSRQFKTNLIG
jgi:hypothetical protein